eukprot:scaffold35214_cov129-Isochrysis_galbana.AAC.2
MSSLSYLQRDVGVHDTLRAPQDPLHGKRSARVWLPARVLAAQGVSVSRRLNVGHVSQVEQPVLRLIPHPHGANVATAGAGPADGRNWRRGGPIAEVAGSNLRSVSTEWARLISRNPNFVAILDLSAAPYLYPNDGGGRARASVTRNARIARRPHAAPRHQAAPLSTALIHLSFFPAPSLYLYLLHTDTRNTIDANSSVN